MRRAVLVYNPKSGRQLSRRLLTPVLHELTAGGFQVDAVPTAGPGDATEIARQAVQAGREVVFAMGGDGTLREAAVGLLGSDVALGVLPAGTANVLTRALGLPRRAPQVARMLPHCQPREMDVGLAGGEPFLMMVSCGVDAAVMNAQSAGIKRYLGRAGIGLSAAGRIFGYTYPPIEVRHGEHTQQARLVVVANIPLYGGGFRMAPEADFQDGLLDLVSFRGSGALSTASFAWDVACGRHQRRSDVEMSQVEEVTLRGPSEILLQVDGDVLPTSLPLTVSLAPQRLRVLMPSAEEAKVS